MFPFHWGKSLGFDKDRCWKISRLFLAGSFTFLMNSLMKEMVDQQTMWRISLARWRANFLSLGKKSDIGRQLRGTTKLALRGRWPFSP